MAPGPLLPETTSIAVMERLGGDEAAGAANSANQSLNPVGMQIYWNLSSLNMAVREAAALALVRELREKQDEFAAGGGRGGVAEVLFGFPGLSFRHSTPEEAYHFRAL